MLRIFFLTIVLLIYNSCFAQNNIKFYYQDKTKATEVDADGYNSYLAFTPKELQKKENEVLLFFNNAAFVNDVVTIDGKSYNFDQNFCGYREIKVAKDKKKIQIASKKKEKIIFNLKKGIDYIIINGDINNKWSVTFSEYFPVMECQ